MDTAVTGRPALQSPEDRSRRQAVVLGAAAMSMLSLIGGIIFLLFAGERPTQPVALKPRPTTTTVAPAPPTTETASASSDGLLGGLSAPTTSSASSSPADLFGGKSTGGAASLPPFQLPPAPSIQPGPPVDWQAVLQPYVDAQLQTAGANLTGAITGPTVGAVSSAINSGAVILGDLILYAAYTNNGQGLLNQLQAALPAAAAIPGLAALGDAPAPDFSGLSAAFAAASSMPAPIGMPAPPKLPPLPTPEQVTAAMAALPALGIGLPQLPPPPQLPGLPTPDQALAGVAALSLLPALLPPPPPIGLPSFGFPPIGLPPIGLPSFGLPSITRMFGLPF